MRHLLVPLAVFAFAAAPALAAQTAESKACSTQATAKALHGKDREAFMAQCKAAAAPAGPATKPAAAKPAAMAPAAAPIAAAPAKATPARAGFAPKSDAAKACSDQATAKGLHGKERETFRDACLKGAPAPMAAAPMKPVAAAKPVPVAEATPPEPGKTAKAAPASNKPRTANQLASDARIKRCGALWQADKAAGKTAGQTWPKYWSACSARLKAAGQ